MISLEHYGWNNVFQPNTTSNTKNELIIGRVTSIQGFKYFVITSSGEMETELAGKLLFGALPEELPKLGDWVQLVKYDPLGYIVEVLPRINEVARKTPGNKTQKQVLAANVDYALIVQGLDRDFNVMRLERYLVQLASCKIKPVVILNKTDLIGDPERYKAEVERLQRDCPIYFCSTYTGVGLVELIANVLEKYKTYILIGSSGVGKSSLLNALMSEAVQKVNATSDASHKGKHTTSTRDLFQLPNGSLMIDTPGMREFGLTSSEEGNSDDLFPAIAEFAAHCRFSDCQHLQETGCAVLAAVDSGRLDRDVYESYLKLIKEQRRFEINAEDKKRFDKLSGRLSREANDHRNKYK